MSASALNSIYLQTKFVIKVTLKLRAAGAGQNLVNLVKYVLTSKNETFTRIYAILSIASIPVINDGIKSY